MKTKHIDSGLNAERLEEKYSSAGYGEHPEHRRAAWRAEVANKDTLVGYWSWVVHAITAAEDNRSSSGTVCGEEGGVVISATTKPDSSALDKFLAQGPYHQEALQSVLELITNKPEQAKRIVDLLDAWPKTQPNTPWYAYTPGFIRPAMGEYLCGPIGWGEVHFWRELESNHRIAVPVILGFNNDLILQLPYDPQELKKIQVPN